MKVSERFAALRAEGRKALVLFVTAGDVPLDDLPTVLQGLERAGADLIEVGLPFSDPFGEGPTIQAASQRALDRGTRTDDVFSAIGRSEVTVPIVTMGYYNMVLRRGLEEFARASAAAGAGGAIINDLVPDEAEHWAKAAADAGQETIFLVAPTSTDRRIDQVAAMTTGFVYIVSRTGVTGAENQLPADVTTLVRKVRARTDKPCCVGFGISTPDHVRTAVEVADGVVVGSALVSRLHDAGKDRAAVYDWVRELKRAVT